MGLWRGLADQQARNSRSTWKLCEAQNSDSSQAGDARWHLQRPRYALLLSREACIDLGTTIPWRPHWAFIAHLGPGRGIAQSGSAGVLGTPGRRFESCCPDQYLA